MPGRASTASASPRCWSAALAAAPFLAVLLVLAPYLSPPGRAPGPGQSDIHSYHAPSAALLARGLREDGELPRWNPQDFAGTPLIADPQAGVYDPVHWLLALSPTSRAFGWLIIASALAGAAGLLAFARSLGCGWGAAAAGATCFVLGGSVLFRLVALGHIGMAPVFLLPWLLLGVEAIARRAALLRGAALACGVAWLAVWMHPQLLVYSALFLLAAGLVAAWRSERPWLTLGALAGVALWSAALSAVHWLPGLALLGEFARARPELRAASAGVASEGAGLLALVTGSASHPEAWFHLGVVALGLALLGAFVHGRAGPHRARARFHAGAALAILVGGLWLPDLAALGERFRHPERIWILLGVPVAVLVALGVEALPGATPGRRRAAAALALAALALELGLPLRSQVRTVPERAIARLPAGLALPDDLDGGARLAEPLRVATERGIPELAKRRLGLESLTGYNPLIPWRFWVYVHFASGIDPTAFDPDATTVPVRRFAHPGLFDRLGVSHFLYAPRRPDGPWRWQRAEAPLPRAYLVPGAVLAPEVAGQDEVRAMVAALERLVGMDPRAQVMLHGEAAAALAAAGVAAGVRLEPFREVPIRERRPNRMTLSLDVEHPAILVVNEPWFPGWRARDGGDPLPLLRADALLRALVLAPGAHEIELEFAPPSWLWGRRVSATALALTVAAVAVGLASRARRAGHPP